MVFNFNHPLILLVFPVLAAYLLYVSRGMTGLSKIKRRIIVILRMTVLLLLILCLAGFGLKTASRYTTTVFLVDSSDSAIESNNKAEEFIKDSIDSKGKNDKVGIARFGADVSAELTPTLNPRFKALQTKINSGFTNIERALNHVVSMIPADDNKRVVLMSDGEENAGNVFSAVNILNDRGISLDVFMLESEEGKDVQLTSIDVPHSVRLNENFDAFIRVDSNIRTTGTLSLYRDRQLVSETDVEIQEGENNFVFPQTAEEGGMITYSAEIDAMDDTISQNNKSSAFVHVDDISNILMIQGDAEEGREIEKILKEDVNIRAVSPEAVPSSLEQLQRYDAFVISNVPVERFSNTFLENLETSIRYMGKGLLVTGGEESYGLGGYKDTYLETVLPVEMDIKTKEEHPNLGLLLVIDKSGSMSAGSYGVTIMELAKEAAIHSTEVLTQHDYVGVIAFDNNVEWVVDTQKLDDLQKVQDAIASIRAGGGTTILPSLEEAVKSLKEDADAKLKHIILLTDGIAERSGYEPVIREMEESGITLSTVAFGQMADTELLRMLANRGNGRYYYVDEFSDMPKIFAKETTMAAKTYINNRQFTPILRSYSPILDDIEFIPDLYGYIRTTKKPSSRVIFSSDEDEPILATWHYGLGRTAAWTSDAKGMWTEDWMNWEESSRFWKNILSWLVQKKVQDDYIVSGGIEDGKGFIEFEMPVDEVIDDGEVRASLISPSGKEEQTYLETMSPGVYRGKFSADETGVYITNVSIDSEGETIDTTIDGIVVPYSPEYNIDRIDGKELLERVVYESGGRIIKNSNEVFSGDTDPIENINDMTDTLLLLALILLMIDITIRRLNISFRKFEVILEKGRSVAAPIKNRIKIKDGKKDIGKDVRVRDGKVESEVEMKKSDEDKKREKIDKNNKDTSHISKLLESKRKRE
ncbi:VWA domain-containing protein [Herbivorax sp. ANBcel31]|uniref:VWA domain-containing protein n=1 Tax=Herbivorax sp. ANBcel31 TaxID=3069754 RepID=UPI0027B1D1FC|nr:VWA domain-containing protein [Herbivorax sp. ANBcel31]MDQ2087186.1 VWA domain-containing protein [Herbivorax sp. ANBcel31]